MYRVIKDAADALKLTNFEVTKNINSCQVIASDTCLASGRTEGKIQLTWKVSLQKQWL
jgi:hypothetical protein